MDFKIVWTLRSRDDLRNICLFISRDNPTAAMKLGDEIFSKVETLQQFPEIGRAVPERSRPDIRQIIVKSYRIIYRVRAKEKFVEVLRIWHGARSEPEL